MTSTYGENDDDVYTQYVISYLIQAKPYLEGKCNKEESKYQSLIWNMAHKHLKRREIGYAHCLLRAERSCK